MRDVHKLFVKQHPPPPPPPPPLKFLTLLVIFYGLGVPAGISTDVFSKYGFKAL